MSSSHSDEKHDKATDHIDDVPRGKSPSVVSSQLPDGELLAPDVRPTAERRLVWTLDTRLLPTIIVIFIMNYIDVSSPALTGIRSVALYTLNGDTGAHTACCSDVRSAQRAHRRPRAIWWGARVRFRMQ